MEDDGGEMLPPVTEVWLLGTSSKGSSDGIALRLLVRMS